MPASTRMPAWNRHRGVEALEKWKRLIPLASPEMYRPGVELFHEGDAAREVFLVEDGFVLLANDLPTGDEAVLDLRFSGQIVDQCTSALETPYPYSARAVTACAVHRIDAASLHARVEQDPQVAGVVFDMLRWDLRSATACIQDLKTRSPKQRLQKFLRYIAHVLGVEPVGRELHVPMPLRDEEIASLLGVSSRQFKRIKKQMQESGQLFMRRSHELVVPVSLAFHQ
jgi:CRP-like cAMP-binding protein